MEFLTTKVWPVGMEFSANTWEKSFNNLASSVFSSGEMGQIDPGWLVERLDCHQLQRR